MSTFEFVSVLMSIVVGLGIARLLSSAASLIEHRSSIRLDFVSLAWAVNVLQYLLIYWWVVVGNWRGYTTFSLLGFTSLFLYGVLLFFCAVLILPPQVEAGVDLPARFESIRRPFFTLWLLVVGVEAVDSFLKGTEYVLTQLGPAWFAVNGVVAVGAIAAYRVSDRRFHKGFAVLVFLVYASWTVSMFRSI